MTYEQLKAFREAADARRTLIALAHMCEVLGLAILEHHTRWGTVAGARGCAKQFLRAADFYQRAGMRRKAEAISRLLDRCRRALLKHHEARGWK